MESSVTSMPPSPQDPSSSDLPSGPEFSGPAHGAPPGEVPAPTAPARSGKKKGLIAAGCGCLALLVLAVGGCSALVFSGVGDDDPAASEETSPAEPAETPSDAAEASEDAPAEEAAEDETAAEDAPAEEEVDEEPAEAPAEENGADGDVPSDHASALKSAETYSDLMHMSKQGIFEQLTSEYGDQFSEEAAQYAVDTLDADWNDNALQSEIGRAHV